MEKPVIAIASDHAGVELKKLLHVELQSYASAIVDLGTNTADSVDYPDYGHALAEAITSGKAQMGVGICGSGIGISIALNRHKTIRAALCTNGLTARLARQHNNANVLCLGARIIGTDIAKDCVRDFFTTRFDGGRHETRLHKLDN